MNTQELLKTALKSLVINKLRTFLTVLGIVIGIMAVITLLNIGQAAQNYITNTIGSLGSNLINVIPGRINNNSPLGLDLSSEFTIKDVEALREAPKTFFTKVGASVSRDFRTQKDSESVKISMTGVYGDYYPIRNIDVAMGRFTNETDEKTLARVAFIGPAIAETLYPGESPIGKKIKVNGVNLTIIGVAKAKGSTGIQNPDELVYVPLSTFQKLFSGDDAIRTIFVQAKDADSVLYAEKEIETILRRFRGIRAEEDADFTIRNSGEVLSTVGQITGVFTVFLGAIGAISLLVGGIGIMNIMFVTVRERTREIGLRKSLGATNRDILLQFLTEAVMLTSVGGMVGTILGIVLTLAISAVAGLTPTITAASILLSVGVSGLIGLVFGIYPARRASQLSPIEALRYE